MAKPRKKRTEAQKAASKAKAEARMKQKAEGLERGELASREPEHWKKPCKDCDHDKDDDCLIGPYDQVRPKCNGDAHHTRLDSAVRTTNRSSTKKGNRMLDAKSIGAASTICLHPDNHKAVHKDIKKRIKKHIGDDGLVPMKKYHKACRDALKKHGGISEECAKKASKAAADEDSHLMENRVRVSDTVPDNPAVIKTILNRP